MLAAPLLGSDREKLSNSSAGPMTTRSYVLSSHHIEPFRWYNWNGVDCQPELIQWRSGEPSPELRSSWKPKIDRKRLPIIRRATPYELFRFTNLRLRRCPRPPQPD